MASCDLRKTRIIATLGPASREPEIIQAMHEAGADVFRINMSHGDRQAQTQLIRNVRKVEEAVDRPIAIMADLQGPKIRLGKFKGGSAELQDGAAFTLDSSDKPGSAKRVNLPHVEVFKALKVGDQVLLDDGRLHLEVEKAGPEKAECRITLGGTLSDHKGVNVPGVFLPLAALTEKDRRDLDFALSEGVDWVALSFVQRPADVAEARKLIQGRAGVLAKIEKPSALAHLDQILEMADAAMVARGDLGVEMNVEDVPSIQREIIKKARQLGKPVVVATQMLETMVTSQIPTRAEVSDVANAVYQGADAVMLSAETAIGKHPVETVRVMDKVARQAERDPYYLADEPAAAALLSGTAEDAITAAARLVTGNIKAAAIVTFTTSGSTALRAARERPEAPVLALTPNLDVARKLCLVWGLQTLKTEDVTSFEEMIGKARRMALKQGLAGPGERIVITAGVPFGTPGSTNALHIAWITGDELRKDKL